LKIALIRKNYTPYGGAENYLKLIAERLKAKGHEIHVISSMDKWSEGVFTVQKVKSVSKPSFLSNMFFVINSKGVLKRGSFDCIFSFERTIYQDIYRAGDGCHKEWLNKRRMVEPFLKRLSFILNPHHLLLLYLERQCLYRSKLIIANSIMVKNDIMKHYSISNEKIQVIYNGVDLQRFHPIPKEQKATIKNSLGLQDNRIILFVGADFERKGLPVLLKAFSILDFRDVKLMVIGKRGRKRYLSMIKKLGIEDKVILWSAGPKIEKLYAIADIFVLPTIYDPFSNATLEAMAAGLPVITTSNNGASELIENGIQGFIIDNPLDINALVEKISITLLNSEGIGKKARIKAEGYSIEKAVDEIIKVISGHGR
jgi:UDP-glucose:(heptosyl)LPS alpha-1,3-glucosyltransferase